MDADVKSLSRSAVSVGAGVVLLYLASVLPTARLALVCAASIGVVFVRLSCPFRWALGCFFATSALALLILPSKTPAILYACFMGYYPFVKLYTERFSSVVFRWTIRIALFNGVALILFFALRAVLTQDLAFASYAPIILLAAGNVFFIVYDYAVGLLILYYLRRFAGKFKP